MGSIDFSPLHNKYVKYEDGQVLPMDVPHYVAEKITPNTWKIASCGDFHYLLIGDGEAITIDTGYGAGNLREYLEHLGGVPVKNAINTHDHFDHSCNNCYFEKVYMAEEGVDWAAIPYDSFAPIVVPRDYESVVVGDNSIIPLAGRDLEVFKIGDHTPGGIALLDRTNRMLFVGDEMMPGKMISGDIEKFASDFEKLYKVRDAFDEIWSGSGRLPDDQVDVFYEAGQRILAGEGEPKEGMGGPGGPPNRPDQFTEDGFILYDWRMPHPGDHSARPRAPMAPGAKMYSLEINGRRFMFHK